MLLGDGKEMQHEGCTLAEYGKAPVLEEIPVPDIKTDEMLVQVKACGMRAPTCGSWTVMQ